MVTADPARSDARRRAVYRSRSGRRQGRAHSAACRPLPRRDRGRAAAPARARGRRPGPVALGCLQAVMHGVLLRQPRSVGRRHIHAIIRPPIRIGPRFPDGLAQGPDRKALALPLCSSVTESWRPAPFGAARRPAGPAPGAAHGVLHRPDRRGQRLEPCRTRRSAAESPSRAVAIASSAAAVSRFSRTWRNGPAPGWRRPCPATASTARRGWPRPPRR
jgi:hypothetical protein